MRITLLSDDKEKIINLGQSGHTTSEISKILQKPYACIKTFIYQNDIKRKVRIPENLIGKKFGKLLIIENTNNFKNNRKLEQHRILKCQCDCGKVHFITKNYAKRATSCGCLRDSYRKRINVASLSWKGHGEISSTFFGLIKRGAKRRNLSFDITIEQIWDLFLKQDRKCAISNVDLKFKSKATFPDGTSSLDRIDSSKGYTIDNIQWVHKEVNNIKQDLTENEFFQWIKTIYENRRLDLQK